MIIRRLSLIALAVITLVPPAVEQPAVAEPVAFRAPATGTVYRWPAVRSRGAFGDSVFVERTPGATAKLRFRGSQVIWYTRVGPSMGIARVLLDGKVVRHVNNHAERGRARVRRRFSAGSDGVHTLKIVVTGDRGAPGGGRSVAVDAFRVDGRFLRADRAKYRWDKVAGSGAADGSYRRSRQRGATSSYTFRGKGIDWIGLAGPRQGLAEVLIDGRVRETVDTSAPTRSYRILASIAGLTDAEHTITVRVLGRRGDGSRGADVSVDGWIVRRPRIKIFRDLGAWVDLYDYRNDAVAATQEMAAYGVKTLYLQTARYNSEATFKDRDGMIAWLEAAHAAGLKVVGWYLPAYDEHLAKDVRRSAAIATFRSPNGHRFDGLAVDIEYRGETESRAEFNDGIRTHLRRVRSRVGNRYPVGGIIPSVLAMENLAPSYWAGFPYGAVGRYTDVVMPMSYWSYRKESGQCPGYNGLYCALRYTEENTREARARTGLPVHIIGGVGDRVTRGEVRDFVEGANNARAIGGSLYDYRTTKDSFWEPLAGLNP